ncbi:DNA polymerase III subunit alpha [Staphylococcus debuckii]|uniref:DNA polymerase III subunit alpha n=1 Tax=Staphylococcus debuckii TaxID=2044912 RepID=UPI000F431448|nr:DNA polymerase III subunit alpha [Staphylococcus debuckii]AYU55465.1 DNA polymerase III subunit alpha [Staphylococcus debuckii]
MKAHLNIHTAYDLLNSSLKVSDIIQKAAQEGYEALAITDTNVLHAVPQFYDESIKAGIKPIFGMTIYLSDGLTEVETVLLAKNETGLKSLYQLSSAIKVQEKQVTPLEWLKRYQEDLALIFKNVTSEQLNLVQNFVEYQDVYVDHQSSGAAERLDLNRVYMQEARYLNPDDADTVSALKAIKDNQTIDLVHPENDEHAHFYSQSEVQDLGLSADIIENTESLADICTAEISYHQPLLPQYSIPDNVSSKTYLWRLLEQSLQEMDLDQPAYRERLEYEFDIITKMGYEDYFLIVSDLIHYAKTHNVMVGPGRGSSAGSLVSYLLNITTIDPLHYNLLFERFLNPERVTMPDIDIDFEDTRREKVIQYVQEKYGEYHVSGIVTFGHLLAKAVARDVGRIMGFEEKTLSEISKLIPSKLGITLNEAYQNEDFKAFVHRNHRHEKWFELSKKLEGLPRHTSTHAAGIIINDRPLYEHVPLLMGDTGLLTQWTMTEDEKLGLLKIDFLGLRNLSIIHQIIDQVKKDLNVSIDTEAIPFDDNQVFEMLSRGDTTGLFQLESDGVRQALKRLQPQHFEDIVAMTSLYRPGPMEEIPTYIARRHDPSKVQYLHPDLEPILKNTYGVIIYQEQIMQIASKFAGFSYGEADILRRAMSKKNRAVLESERQHFVEGANQNGYSEQLSKQIFDLILKFADYGFPRAHAVSYSKVAYIMAYLKVHYPNYFYANILTNSIGNEKKTELMITEAKSMDLKILPPDINESHWYYKATSEGIYLSLGAVKGVGFQSVKAIVDERYARGKYKDFFDLTRRLPNRVKTRKLLEALILVGAFDHFKENRATLLSTLDQVLDGASNVEQDELLFEFVTPKESYEEKEELPDQVLSDFEKEHLGFYISKHPVEKMFKNKQLLGIYKLSNAQNNQPILVQIDKINRIRTKNGQPMAFVTLNDGTNTLDGVIFPNVFKQIEDILEESKMFIGSGKFEKRQNQMQLIINHLDTLDHYEKQKFQHAKMLVLRNIAEEELNLASDDEASNNSIPVNLYHTKNNQMEKIGYIERDIQALEDFMATIPPENIRII